jgi:MYXO-CTERM domain-containing protein
VKVDGPNVVADDFLCTASGPITAVHFWGSWRGDQIGLISNVELSLHTDIPADPNDPLYPYSRPGGELWLYNSWLYDPGLVTIVEAGSGTQGWYDPITPSPGGTVIFSDHQKYYQVNVQIDPSKWYSQQAGTIYWLDIHVTNEVLGTEFGWKTSLDHWNDDAVVEDYWDTLPPEIGWIELHDPDTAVSLDMAYVVVPEPHAGLFLLLGAAGLLARRRRNSIPGRTG